MVDRTRSSSSSINRMVAAGFGAIYTLVGLAGFFVSDTFAAREDDALLGFQVNHLHNIVHLLIGLALLAASRQQSAARSANLAIGATYVVLGVLGPFIVGTQLNILALNSADHVLHVLSGLLLVVVALVADKHTRNRVRA